MLRVILMALVPRVLTMLRGPLEGILGLRVPQVPRAGLVALVLQVYPVLLVP